MTDATNPDAAAALEVPDFSLVVLVGASGAGKTTLCRRLFRGGEVLSSDAFRVMVRDDESDPEATEDAFEALAKVAELRLRARRLTVVDATNLSPDARARWTAMAKRFHAPAVAVVIDAGAELLRARLEARTDRDFPPAVLKGHRDMVRRSVPLLRREGFGTVRVLSPEEAGTVPLVRRPLWTDRRDLAGPFDVIGDVHGCADELELLLDRLGYAVAWSGEGAARRAAVTRPDGGPRRPVFVGDLVDRGPRNLDVLRIAMGAVAAGGLAVPGNHDDRFARWLRGNKVTVQHGLADTVREIEAEPAFRRDAGQFLEGLVSHLWLDGGALAVAHAGVRADMVGRASARVRDFCLYGDPDGKDEDGKPVRRDWAADHRGPVAVVYGHTPKSDVEWVNGTACVDTGCVLGGKLSALRWPEREVVSVDALRTYHEGRIVPVRPQGLSAQAAAAADASPDVAELVTDRVVETTLAGRVKLGDVAMAGAVETYTRHGVDPRWLAYLPPTMSPADTSRDPSLMERPEEALRHYAGHAPRVVLETKHMGSRLVACVCRDPAAAARRFGVLPSEGVTGALFTRTGQPFFADAATAEAELARMRADLGATRFWERHGTDWVMLDCEALPWSAKAGGLVRRQFAPVSANGEASLRASADALASAAARGVAGADVEASRQSARLARVAAYGDAWRAHVAAGPDEPVSYAVFHVLAFEGAVPILDRPHEAFHLAEASLLADASPTFVRTPHLALDPSAPDAAARADAFWREVLGRGGEGVVVKPDLPVTVTSRGMLQPGLKVRGPEYLRIVYGPEYDDPANLVRLRLRHVSARRRQALREFALGADALSRFVAGAPAREVRERVLAVLALEQEVVDARL